MEHQKFPNEPNTIELLMKILSKVERNTSNVPCLYDNQSLMQMLHIKDKYLKKLRDNGYLSYSREGDKYWYTQKDVDDFLKRFHHEAFASGTILPPFK